MPKTEPLVWHKACVLAVAILCLIGLGIGQPRMTLADEAPSDLAAYAMPDGTLPVLCAADKTQGKAPHHSQHCLACVSLTSFPAPPPTRLAARRLHVIDRLSLRETLAHVERPWRRDRARGPPAEHGLT